MTSCLHRLVRVCLAVISLVAVSHRIFNNKTIVTKYFTSKYQTLLHFLCSCSYLFTFLLSSQFYWHIRLKSTAYFFDPPRRYGSSWGHSSWQLGRIPYRFAKCRVVCWPVTDALRGRVCIEYTQAICSFQPAGHASSANWCLHPWRPVEYIGVAITALTVTGNRIAGG